MKYAPYLSLALFALACCLPVVRWQPENSMFGAWALAIGWGGVFVGVFAWCANPVWALGVFFCLMRKYKVAAILGLIALALALTTFRAIGRELPADEGGVAKMTIVGLLPGFYVWLTSILTLLIGSLFGSAR